MAERASARAPPNVAPGAIDTLIGERKTFLGAPSVSTVLRRSVSGVRRAGRVAAEPEEHEDSRGHESANEGGKMRVRKNIGGKWMAWRRRGLWG